MQRRLFLALAVLAAALPAGALASGGGEKKKAGGDSYLPVQTLLGATVRPGGKRGVLSVECGLDIPSNDLRARAGSVLPRLRAAYNDTVRTYAAGLPAGYPPNVEFIGRTLQAQTDQILGRPGARLLLGAVVVN